MKGVRPACRDTRRKIPKGTRCADGPGEVALLGQPLRMPFRRIPGFLQGRHSYPHSAEGRLRQRCFESSELAQGRTANGLRACGSQVGVLGQAKFSHCFSPVY